MVVGRKKEVISRQVRHSLRVAANVADARSPQYLQREWNTCPPVMPATVEIQNLAVPELKGFKVLLGPTKSSATNVEKVDGEINRKYQESYTYVLQVSPGKIQ